MFFFTTSIVMLDLTGSFAFGEAESSIDDPAKLGLWWGRTFQHVYRIGIIGDQRYRNLSQALKHAQEKIADLDHALEYSRKRADTLNKKLKQSQQELNALVHENKKKEESVDTITAAAMQATQIAPPSCPKPSPCHRSSRQQMHHV